MKRSAMLAALALTPVLMHAQAITPTPTKASSPAQLQAKLMNSTSFEAAAGSSAASVPANVRISTGVVAPRLVHTVDVQSNPDWQWRTAGLYRTAVVAMTVDETGKPTNLKIIQSAGSDLDENVLAAVNQYRFAPGTVSNQPTSIELNLRVDITNPYR